MSKAFRRLSQRFRRNLSNQMKLHVVTRCTRPQYLRAIHESFKGNELTWHVVFDVSAISEIDVKLLHWLYSVAKVYFKEGEPGSYMYPQIGHIVLENTKPGELVMFLDDDNIMHPDYYETITSSFDNNSFIAICYHQLVDLNINSVRIAKSENTIVGGIDLAQYTLMTDVFHCGKFWFNPGYTGDGELIQQVHYEFPDKFLFVDKVLCYYNYLQQSSPKKTSAPNILYIGEGKPELKSFPHLGYEDTSLNVEYAQAKDLIWEDYDFSKYDAIVSAGGEWEDIPHLSTESSTIRNKWIHLKDEVEVNGELAYNVAMNSILTNHRPKVSFFTPAYKTPINRIQRLYNSIEWQTEDDWEWVVVNDSPDDKNLSEWLKMIQSIDPRVKVYTFEKPSGGCIGDVKYKAASLCRGELLAEVDHDDELLPLCAKYLIDAYKAYPHCGFFYTNCVEVDENYTSLKYPDGFAFGYGKYRETYDWSVQWKYEESICVGINPKTIRHIVGVPNHIRAWRRDVYNKIGGHNRGLTIADDYELIVRTFLETRFCHIDACGYIQFIYNNATGQNTHDATRGDIQRRVRTIAQHYNHDIANRFHYLGVKDWAYEFNPANPLLAPSRYGGEENAVNVVYNPKSVTKN